MAQCISVTTSFASYFKLSTYDQPKDDDEKTCMRKLPYAIVVGSHMYAMICTRPYLSYPISVLSKFMDNPKKSH